MKFTTNKQKVYYIAFPCVVMLLCFASYKIGYQKGIYKITHDESIEEIVDRQVFKKPDKLMFFEELNKKEKKVENDGRPSVLKRSTAPAEKPVPETKPEEKITPKPADLAETSTLETTHPNFPDSLVIQLSAFKDQDMAQGLVEKLQKQGFIAFLVSQEGDSVWHRVFVGPYAKRINADEAIQKLEQKGFGRGFIVDKPLY